MVRAGRLLAIHLPNGENGASRQGWLSQIIRQAWNPGHWAPSRGSPGLGVTERPLWGSDDGQAACICWGVNRTRNPAQSWANKWYLLLFVALRIKSL